MSYIGRMYSNLLVFQCLIKYPGNHIIAKRVDNCYIVIRGDVMKKLIILLSCLCIPVSAMAMKLMDDDSLSGVSGQSGVSFFVDISMNIHIDTLAWGDSDGLAPGPYNPWSLTASGGYVGVSNLTVSGLSAASHLAGVSSNSVGFWPESGAIDVLNGVPYYRTKAGVGVD
jgi:hypothetical protein